MFLTDSIVSKQYFRENVINAELLCAKENGVLLKTSSIIKGFSRASSDDMQMFERIKNAGVGEQTEGRLLIEFFKNDVLRVRFFRGTEILENETPMVSGKLDAAACEFEQNQDKVVVNSGNITVTINLKPYSLVVFDNKKGRKIEVSGAEKNFFNFRDSLNTGVCYLGKENVTAVTENFALNPGEAVYGFGEKFIKLNKVGQTIEFDTCDGIGIGTPRTYKNVPFYVTTGGYGAYFNHTGYMTFFVGSMYAGDIQVAIQDDFLDYYIFVGDIKEVLNSYTDLTGKSPMPPLWSFGYWQSKLTYHSAEETLDIVDNMHKNDIPLDVIHIDTHWFKKDWWCDWEFEGEDRFKDPAGYIKDLADRGVKLSLWQLPYVREGTKAYDEFMAVDGFVKRADGEVYDLRDLKVIMHDSPVKVGVIDFTNPAACEVYKELLRRLFRIGVKVIKTDFGEAAPSDGVYFDGTPGYKMHNLYPLYYDRAAYEANKEINGEGIVWGRSAYAGNQRYPLYWGGDNSPNYYNIMPQLMGGLSFGLSGFPFWSQDVGGFLGDTYDDLLIRWMQFSVLMSHIRIHGNGNREIYKFNDQCKKICKDYLQLRYRLLPYLWGSSLESCKNGTPITAALAIEFQNDKNVWNIEDQYMSGRFLMVAPIYTRENNRSLYLPSGVWTDWHTGEKIDGGKWFDITADVDILPLYVREGAIIPLGPVMNYVGEKKIDDIELRIYPFACCGESSFNINTGDEIIPVTYKAANGEHTVTVGKTKSKINLCVCGNAEVKLIKE